MTIPFPVKRPVSPDGRWILGGNGPGTLTRYPLQEGEPRRVTGIEKGEVPIGWNADGFLFVRSDILGAVLVHLVDPDSGRRTLWKRIPVPDPGSIVERMLISADGRSYAYFTRRVHSQLYVVEGLE